MQNSKLNWSHAFGDTYKHLFKNWKYFTRIPCFQFPSNNACFFGDFQELPALFVSKTCLMQRSLWTGSGRDWDPGRWWKYTWGNYTWCYTITTIMSYSYTWCYIVITIMSYSLRWAVLRAILMFHSLWGAKPQDGVKKSQLLKRKESQSRESNTHCLLPSLMLHCQTKLAHTPKPWIWNRAVNLKPEDFQAPQMTLFYIYIYLTLQQKD